MGGPLAAGGVKVYIAIDSSGDSRIEHSTGDWQSVMMHVGGLVQSFIGWCRRHAKQAINTSRVVLSAIIYLLCACLASRAAH